MTASDAETALAWQLRAVGYPEPVTEHRFAPPRRWRFDFAWPDRMVAVEIEGGIHIGGRHVRGAGFEGDCLKYGEAAIAGWTVLRVTPAMVDDGRALGLIERALT